MGTAACRIPPDNKKVPTQVFNILVAFTMAMAHRKVATAEM